MVSTKTFLTSYRLQYQAFKDRANISRNIIPNRKALWRSDIIYKILNTQNESFELLLSSSHDFLHISKFLQASQVVLNTALPQHFVEKWQLFGSYITSSPTGEILSNLLAFSFILPLLRTGLKYETLGKSGWKVVWRETWCCIWRRHRWIISGLWSFTSTLRFGSPHSRF